MIDILHIIQCLADGGAPRAVAAVGKQSSLTGRFCHRVLSILPPTAGGRQLAHDAGMEIVSPGPDKSVRQYIDDADIVQMHFWNSPELYRFLGALFPPMRLIVWFHVAGDHPPQIIRPEIVAFADLALACSPYQFSIAPFRDLPEEMRAAKTDLVIAPPEPARLKNITPRAHEGFNVGYIGTVDPVKMHPDFLDMSAGVRIPEACFIVCGGGQGEVELRKMATSRGIADRFEFRGFVEDIVSVIEVLDVFGYPLCAGNYSAADLVLQEVMLAGVPPVIFAHGGTQVLVQDGETGLIVRDAPAYQRAIEELHASPEKRKRLGRNARRYAQQHFGAEIAARRLNGIYERIMQQPKHRRGRLMGGGEDRLQPVAAKGARTFVYALGHTAAAFGVSLYGTSVAELIDAERIIANSGPLLRGSGSGGVFQYRNAYPDDPYLRLWTGLILRAQGFNVRAYIEFRKAIELGFDHWRVHGYLAQSARSIGATKVAQEAAEVIRGRAPAYLEVFGEDGGRDGAKLDSHWRSGAAPSATGDLG